MTITEFIQEVLIGEIGDIVKGHPYLSFGVVSQGIELLGACLDENEFDCKKRGVSGDRFNFVLRELFPEKKYDEFGVKPDSKASIYKDLRCGFLHNVLPKKAFSLTEIKNTPSRLHLSKGDAEDGSQRYVLVAEEFYKDFIFACEKLIQWINSGEILDRQEIRILTIRITNLSRKPSRNSKEEKELQVKAKKHAILTQQIDFLNTNLKIKISE